MPAMPVALLVMAPRIPATRVPCQELFDCVQFWNSAVFVSCARNPVARVGGIRVTPVTVVGGEEIPLRVGADHVVAGQQAVGGRAAQVRDGQSARRCRALRSRRRCCRVVRSHASTASIAAGLGVLHVPLAVEQRVIGHGLRVATLVHLGVLAPAGPRAGARASAPARAGLHAQQLDAGDERGAYPAPGGRRGRRPRSSSPALGARSFTRKRATGAAGAGAALLRHGRKRQQQREQHDAGAGK